MLYDSPAWQWGPGICTKHAGQSVPCRVCIDRHDPDLIKAEAQSVEVDNTVKMVAFTKETRDQLCSSPEPTRTMPPLGAFHFELGRKKQKWCAEVINVILANIPKDKRDKARTAGITLPGKTYYIGAWDNAKTWNEYIAELQKVVDEPIRQPITLTCVKPSHPPAQLSTERVEGIEPNFRHWSMTRRAGSGIPLHLLRPATHTEWAAGDSFDLFFDLPVEIQSIIHDVRRRRPDTSYSMLVRAAHQTMQGRTINHLQFSETHNEAIQLICSLTHAWKTYYNSEQAAAD